jgi:hypothetical protein
MGDCIGDMAGGTIGQTCGVQIDSRSSVLLHKARTSPLTQRHTHAAWPVAWNASTAQIKTDCFEQITRTHPISARPLFILSMNA